MLNRTTHIIILTLVFTILLQAQQKSEVESKVRLIADSILAKTTFSFHDVHNGNYYNSLNNVPGSARLVLDSPYNDWRYWNGVLNIAMIELSNALHEPKYKDFAKANVQFCFDSAPYFAKRYNKEDKWSYPFAQFFIMEELDDCGAMGASVIEVFKIESQARLKQYIDTAAYHIVKKQTRLEDGTLVRTFPVRYTLWADDLYMSVVFLSRMGALTHEQKYFDIAAQQVINFHKYLRTKDGIMVHNWYSDNQRQGVACWGRANGWAILAQIDLLERIPKNHPQRSTLLKLFQDHLLNIARFQDENGLWHQLLDKPDSFEETSCSAMFTYAFAKAVTLGILPQRYASVAMEGWKGIATRIQSDGTVLGVCTGTVVSDNVVDYYKRPTPVNDVHGIGTIVLAGSAVLELLEQETARTE